MVDVVEEEEEDVEVEGACTEGEGVSSVPARTAPSLRIEDEEGPLGFAVEDAEPTPPLVLVIGGGGGGGALVANSTFQKRDSKLPLFAAKRGELNVFTYCSNTSHSRFFLVSCRFWPFFRSDGELGVDAGRGGVVVLKLV